MGKPEKTSESRLYEQWLESPDRNVRVFMSKMLLLLCFCCTGEKNKRSDIRIWKKDVKNPMKF